MKTDSSGKRGASIYNRQTGKARIEPKTISFRPQIPMTTVKLYEPIKAIGKHTKNNSSGHVTNNAWPIKTGQA